jgi:hypothetical protein
VGPPPGKLKDLIPDILIKPNKIIDAKFPCDENKTYKGKGQFPSERAGRTMAGSKELKQYKQIRTADGQPCRKPKVQTMTPEKAAKIEKKKGKCPCEQIKQ